MGEIILPERIYQLENSWFFEARRSLA
jgi:hypothetical protein